jgi:nucleotide-binding universal stress UspA family protein
MKSILIPTDFSPFSMSAVKTGVYIARKTGASIHLLNICQTPEEWDRLKVEQQQRFPEIEGRIVEAEIKVQKLSEDPLFKDLTVFTAVVGGTPPRKIIDYAEKFKIDLIVIGAHGFNEAEGPFIGSTAQKIVRMAPCLVLSVKKNFKPTSLKKLIFACDFQDAKSKDPFKSIKKFALDIGARIDFAYINTPSHFQDSQTIEENLQKYAQAHHDLKPGFFVQNDYSTEGGIVNVSKRVKANMVALVTHNRKGKSNYLLGVTETVLFHSDVPVLSKVM